MLTALPPHTPHASSSPLAQQLPSAATTAGSKAAALPAAGRWLAQQRPPWSTTPSQQRKSLSSTMLGSAQRGPTSQKAPR